MPSRWTGTTGTPQRQREVGGAAAERLAPAVGAAAALGEDQHLQPSSMQLGGLVGRAAARPWCARSGWRRWPAPTARRGDPGAEEVVGGRADEHLVAPRLGDRGEQQRRVEVAVVVGGEDHRAVERRRAGRCPSRSGAPSGGDGRAQRPPRASTRAGEAGREAAGPVGVVVGARGGPSAASGSTPAGHGGRRVGERQARQARASVGERRPSSRHVRHDDRRVVQVGDRRRARPTTSLGHLERVVQGRRRREAEPAHRPRLAADDDHLAEVLPARGSPSTTCRTGGRRGRRSSCGRGGGTTRPRRTASRSVASISTGSVVSASTCSKKSM